VGVEHGRFPVPPGNAVQVRQDCRGWLSRTVAVLTEPAWHQIHEGTHGNGDLARVSVLGSAEKRGNDRAKRSGGLPGGALGLVIVLLAAGCGGEDEETTGDRGSDPAPAEPAAVSESIPPDLRPYVADWRVPDTGGPHPVVLLLHGCAGLEPATADSLEAHADALRDAGYATLTVDGFGPRRRRDGSVCRDPGLARSMVEARTEEVTGLLDHLAGQPGINADRLFLLGQSHGGAAALAATRTEGGDRPARPAGIVALYPWCPPDLNPDPSVPVLLVQAASDDWVPVRSCDSIADRPPGAAAVDRLVYPDTEHGFDLPVGKILVLGRVLKSDPGRTRQARAAIRRFLDGIGSSPN